MDINYEEIDNIASEIHEISSQHGWWEGVAFPEEIFPEKIALAHSELSEALEAWRLNRASFYFGEPDADGHLKPEGWATELIDCVIRILDICRASGLDVGQILKVKIEYNKTRPYRHGGLRA